MKMTFALVALLLSLFGFFAWKVTARNAYESAAYTVLRTDDNIELREYPDLLMATTAMSQMDGDDGSFGRLFRYISGENDAREKIAMTTPVFMEPDSRETTGQMGFVIPAEIAESSVPQPASDQVQVRRRKAGTFAVIRFAGRLNDQSRIEQIQKLRLWLVEEGLQPIGDPELAGYDPPWTPGPFRRNEILIRVRN